MSKFWKTKTGKILSYGLHEHSSGLGYISTGKSLMDKLIKNGSVTLSFKDKETEEMYTHSFELVLKGKDKCKKSIDYIYENLKEKEMKK